MCDARQLVFSKFQILKKAPHTCVATWPPLLNPTQLLSKKTATVGVEFLCDSEQGRMGATSSKTTVQTGFPQTPTAARELSGVTWRSDDLGRKKREGQNSQFSRPTRHTNLPNNHEQIFRGTKEFHPTSPKFFMGIRGSDCFRVTPRSNLGTTAKNV